MKRSNTNTFFHAALVALLGSVTAATWAAAPCQSIAGTYSGTFDAKNSTAEGPASVPGIWTIDMDMDCRVIGSVMTEAIGSWKKLTGEYKPTGAPNATFAPERLQATAYESGGSILLGGVPDSDKGLVRINKRYTGVLRVTSIDQTSAGTAMLHSKANNQDIELSVLSEEKAQRLFDFLAARPDIRYDWLYEGAMYRAQKMALLLDDRLVTSGKAFVEGAFYLDPKPEFAALKGMAPVWFHVAPVVLVRRGSENVPYILDPSLFSKPVPHTVWKEKLLAKPKSKLKQEYYTNRFAYTPDDKNAKLDDYQEDALNDMDRGLRNIARDAYVLESMKR
ncbi:protein-glutamine glutaminase family protein [Ralstonia soli]|uniref:Protein-glutamine glutaminase family protein n=1 Tax=Ralstonia soli TaxID=2953896 RepID=A0ABT1AUK2_9RALS|nr:protein-glutamine glutaminase family protein [Ralstonia soli]MCO5401582.1 protein-glutamine glutaminase family protein [Ralstonia soli]